MKIKAVLSCLVFLACGVAAIGEYTAKPLPCGPKVYTHKKYAEATYKNNRRTFVGDYKKFSARDPKWDTQALEFLENFSKLISNTPDAPSLKVLTEKAQAAIDAGCNDPMVQSNYGALLYLNRRFVEAEQVLQQSFEDLQKSKYPMVHIRLMPYNLRQVKQAQKKEWTTEDQKELADLTLKFTLESMRDGSYVKGEERFALASLLPADRNIAGFDRTWEGLLKAINEKPPSDPYVYKVAAARCHIKIAWERRGTGLAYTVTEQGWKGFFEQLKIARKLLVEAYKLHPEYPEAASEMITVSMADGDSPEPPRQWFDRAVAAQFDYMSAYSAMRYNLLPKWLGSNEEVYAFGVECLKTGRFDTDVPWVFFNVIASLNETKPWDKSFWTSKESTKYLGMLFDGYIKSNYGNEPNWYSSRKAATAWYCGRYSEAKKLIDDLGDQFNPNAFESSHNVKYNDVRGEIEALGGAFGEKIADANKLAAQGKLTEALAVYEELAEQEENNEYTSKYLSDKILDMDTDIEFNKGEWIDLKVPTDLCGWSNLGGQWKVTDDGILEGTSDKKGLILLTNQDYPDNFELHVEFEIVEAGENANAGLAILPIRPAHTGCVSATVIKDKKTALLRWYYYPSMTQEIPNIDYRDHNSVDAMVRGRLATISVNGKEVGRLISWNGGDYPPDERFHVGFCGYCWQPGTTVKFYNFKIRKLPADEP